MIYFIEKREGYLMENINPPHSAKPHRFDFKIVKTKLQIGENIRFFDLNLVNCQGEKENLIYEDISIVVNNKYVIPLNSLSKSYSNILGTYFDLPTELLKEGIHELYLKYNEYYSFKSLIFIKSKENILDYNVCFGTECNHNTDGFISGSGQNIESTTEWCHQGTRSLKITRVGTTLVWTDIPINNAFYGDTIEIELTAKCNCNLSIFFVYYHNGGQSFSKRYQPPPSNNPQKIFLKGKINKRIDRVHLRLLIEDEEGSSVYIDNINIYNKKINVAIYGSCISKDPFTSTFNKNYKSRYTAKINDQRHSIISSMQPKELVDNSLLELDSDYNGGYFITKCLVEDCNKNFIYSLLIETIDYLVTDVYFEIDTGIIYYDDNKIITNAKGIESTPYYKKMKNIRPLNMFNNPDVFYRLWTEYCDKFFDFLKSYCPNIKVVLAEVRTLDIVEKEDGSIYQDPTFTEKVLTYNPFIIKLENYIKNHYDVDIIPFDDNTLLKENHIWGKWQVHYHDRYYSNFLKAFGKIIEKNNKK